MYRVSFSISGNKKSNQHVLEHKDNHEVGERYSALLKQFLSTIFDKTTVNNQCQNITPYIFLFPSNILPPAMLLIVLLALLITRKEIKAYEFLLLQNKFLWIVTCQCLIQGTKHLTSGKIFYLLKLIKPSPFINFPCFAIIRTVKLSLQMS